MTKPSAEQPVKTSTTVEIQSLSDHKLGTSLAHGLWTLSDPRVQVSRFDLTFLESTATEKEEIISPQDGVTIKRFIVGTEVVPGIKYSEGATEEVIRARLQQLEHPVRSSHKPVTADKVESREMAASVGILPQPEWFDLRNCLNFQCHRVSFKGISFTNLPLADLFDNTNQLKAIQFEDPKKGFRISARDNSFVIETENPQVERILGKSGTELREEELLIRLAQLSDSPYSVTHFSTSNDQIRREQLRDILLTLDDGVWFLKSVDGARGNHVVKMKIEGGNITSSSVSELQKDLFQEKTGKNYNETEPVEIVEHMFCPRNSDLVAVTKGIIEKGINTESVDGVLSEQRVVFAFNGEPYYLCSYSKVIAGKDRLPNLSQGGEGEAVRTSFERILRAHNIPEENVESKIQETVERLKSSVTEFAIAFNREAKERGYHYGPVFAVDVCPVWNEEKQQIDYTLLEVQPGPGTEGAAGNVPEDEQQLIDDYNRGIEEFEDQMY